MGVSKHEPTIEELLSDPMMAPVFGHTRMTADYVRSLMREAHDRLAKVRAADSERAAMESGELRVASRWLLDQIKTTADHESRRRLAERAFEIAQWAEQLQRGL